MPSSVTRRRFLQACGAALSLTIAGCGTIPRDQPDPTTTTTSTTTTQEPPTTTKTSASSRGPLAPGTWTQFGADPQNTGTNPDATGPRNAITERWRFETDSWVESAPAIHDNTLYITSGDRHVYAIDATTGDEHWRYATGIAKTASEETSASEPVMRSNPAVANGLVLVGGGNEERRTKDNEVEVVERHIYLNALDAATGELVWRFQPTGKLWGSPTLADGVVYIGDTAGTLYALDVADGRERWQIPELGKLTSAPAVNDDTVYVGSWNQTLYAFDTQDGSEQWLHPTSQAVSAAPAVGDDTVIIAENGGGPVTALDTQDGSERWQTPSGGTVASSPALTDDTVYVGDYTGRHDESAARLHAFDRETGDTLWSSPTAGYIWASPAVVENTVYVGCLNNYLYGFDAQSGEERWRYETGDLVRSSPAVTGNTVYAGSLDGTIYALTES